MSSVQFSFQSCSTLCDPMNCNMPGFPVYHQLPELVQIHVHQVSDAIQPSHPLLSPSPPAFNLSQHQGLFQWVSSSHEVAKVLEFQLQHQLPKCPAAQLMFAEKFSPKIIKKSKVNHSRKNLPKYSQWKYFLWL